MPKTAPSTPTEFLIDAMDDLDDVAMVLIVRRHMDGAISYDTNTHSLWDQYAMASAASGSMLGHIVLRTAADRRDMNSTD